MTPPRRPRYVSTLLVLIPVWLVLSAAVGIYLLLNHEKKQSLVEQTRFTRSISILALTDDLHKIVTVIGERNSASETAAVNLTRTASMIEGLLGPSNTGFTVKKHPGPAAWPILQVTVRGKSEVSPLWIATSYDSHPGSRGAEANASGLAATLAAAQALASDKPARSIHFAFLPHANDPDSPILETSKLFRDLAKAGSPSTILCIEAMGSGETLWLTSRLTNPIPADQIKNLGKVVGAEVACLGEDTDMANVLFEFGLPATRVATRPIVLKNEPDDREPFPATVAASTGRLVELIRRLAK